MSKARPLSLYPLSFDEAVTDILKVKPEPKAEKRPKPKSRGSREMEEQRINDLRKHL